MEQLDVGELMTEWRLHWQKGMGGYSPVGVGRNFTGLMIYPAWFSGIYDDEGR